MLLDGHFVLEHVARAGSGLYFNFNGTAGVLRKSMIDDAGGWQHDTLTEDSDLSYRAQLKGWKFIYMPGVECPSELPVDMQGFQTQQARWSKGLTQVSLKLLPTIFRAKLPWRTKFEAVMHLTPNVSYPMMMVVAALMLPVMIVRFYMGWWQMLILDLPLVIASFCSISSFYLLAYHEVFPTTWKRGIAFIPVLMAAGVALTVSNTKAVLEALLHIQTAFARTPKYAIERQRVKLKDVKYRSKSGLLPLIEFALGGYFVFMLAYAIDSFNFLAVPFLTIFVAGYWWAALTKLWSDWQGRLQWHRRRRLELQQASQ
jgi:cellulose synthase/poly-beta-1,6-N-acetylglucosamine synthase-like glycosyltransferase